MPENITRQTTHDALLGNIRIDNKIYCINCIHILCLSIYMQVYRFDNKMHYTIQYRIIKMIAVAVSWMLRVAYFLYTCVLCTLKYILFLPI